MKEIENLESISAIFGKKGEFGEKFQSPMMMVGEFGERRLLREEIRELIGSFGGRYRFRRVKGVSSSVMEIGRRCGERGRGKIGLDFNFLMTPVRRPLLRFVWCRKCQR